MMCVSEHILGTSGLSRVGVRLSATQVSLCRRVANSRLCHHFFVIDLCALRGYAIMFVPMTLGHRVTP